MLPEATIVLRGLSAGVYEQSHGVLIDDEALQAAAATLLSATSSGRQLPDKAIDVLDTAPAARVAINLPSPPRQPGADHPASSVKRKSASLSVKFASACGRTPHG